MKKILDIFQKNWESCWGFVDFLLYLITFVNSFSPALYQREKEGRWIILIQLLRYREPDPRV